MRGTETDEESAPSGCGEVKLEFPGRQLTDRQTDRGFSSGIMGGFLACTEVRR